jgi:hypothetical protein
LDIADQYLIVLEVKGGHPVWDGSEKPVWMTSNYSPEQLLAGHDPARIQALNRRFTMIEVRWESFGRLKFLRWIREPGSQFELAFGSLPSAWAQG